ncbi:hypothetical protein ACFL6C_00375 [Myxococcota bacterium]
MPITYEIDRNAGMVRLSAREDLSLEDDTTRIQQVLIDPDFEAGMPVLVDCRKNRPFADGDYVWGLTDAFVRAGAGEAFGKIAIVVSKQVSVGLANMFCTLVGGDQSRMRVFEDVSEACDWLRGLEAQPSSNGRDSSNPG